MDGVQPERCDECGFDATKWLVRDAVTVFDALGWWWSAATDGIDAAELNRRPAPGVWSVLEYGFHSGIVTAMHRAGLELILDENDVALPPVPDLGGDEAEPAVLDA